MASHHYEPIPVTFTSQPTEYQQAFSCEPPAASGSSKKRQLRVGFQPCDYSVVCGRGKDSFNHAGNRRFRILAGMFIDTYSKANSKAAKSAIVSEMIAVIRQAGGYFCKYERDTDTWFQVGDHCAREKVSALLRDLLHTQYRSSAKAKIDRRQNTVRKHQQSNAPAAAAENLHQHQHQSAGPKQQRVEDGTEDHSDNCTTTSSCWGNNKNSSGFEDWLTEESDDFFDIEVF
jgi:hypothetical protein